MFGQKMKFTRRSKEYSTGILHIVAGFPSLFVQMFNLTRDIVYRLCIFSLCFNCLQTIRTTKDDVFIIFQLRESLLGLKITTQFLFYVSFTFKDRQRNLMWLLILRNHRMLW